MTSAPRAPKSKTAATWIALIGGAAGLHRFYLFGPGDRWGWTFPLPSLLGLYGVWRMREFGMDDPLAGVLIPILGLALSVAMACAIGYGLTPDERWNARFNATAPCAPMDWRTVIGVALALIMGAGILMATIAFAAQRYFEYEAQAQAQAQAQAPAQATTSASPAGR